MSFSSSSWSSEPWEAESFDLVGVSELRRRQSLFSKDMMPTFGLTGVAMTLEALYLAVSFFLLGGGDMSLTVTLSLRKGSVWHDTEL